MLTPLVHSAPQIAGQSGFVIRTRASRTCRLNLVSSRHQGNWSWSPTSPKSHLWYKCLLMSSILLILWEIVSYILFQSMQLACISSEYLLPIKEQGTAIGLIWMEETKLPKPRDAKGWKQSEQVWLSWEAYLRNLCPQWNHDLMDWDCVVARSACPSFPSLRLLIVYLLPGPQNQRTLILVKHWTMMQPQDFTLSQSPRLYWNVSE